MTGPAFFKGQVICQVEMTILYKTFCYFKLPLSGSQYFKMKHFVCFYTTMWFVEHYTQYSRPQHKMKVGLGRNFSKILTKF